jgi:mono/diheme cytochrome c family protein
MRFAIFLALASLASGAEPADLFEAKIRPLLVNRCYACHTETASAGLRVDSRAALLKGGKSGPAIVPGDPSQSLLIQAVAHTHARLKMPPTGTLDPQDVANLDQWVRDGAVFPESPRVPNATTYILRPDQKAFWSFQPVRKQEAPQADRPEWNRNPVDQFIYAKLKEKGLTPGKKADKATLLRRVTFDLTGLPATREEIAAFVNDPSPDAFEKRIDRLMASQQYANDGAATGWIWSATPTRPATPPIFRFPRCTSTGIM